MASEPSKKRLLVESDFLFGLRKSDRFHRSIIRSLDMHRNGAIKINVLSSAIMEVRTVLYSRGLKLSQIEDVLSLMDQRLNDYKVTTYVPVKITDGVLAERLRTLFPNLTFFDSLHAAISKRLDAAMLSSDPIYKEIGVSSFNYNEL